MRFRFYILILALVLLALPVIAQKKSRNTEIPTVDFCDLVNNHSDYDKKIIRTKAFFTSGYHGTSIFDYRCDSGDAYMNASGEKSKTYRTKKQISKKYDEILNTNLEGNNGKAEVTVVGRFNDWNGVGYGHLSLSRFEFAVMAFESIEPMDSSVKGKSRKSEFIEEVENLRNLNASMILDYSEDKINFLDQIFSSNYQFIDLEGKISSKSTFYDIFSAAKTTRQKAVIYGKIFIDGDKATANGVQAIAFICPKTYLFQYRYDNYFEKQDGYWKLVKTKLTSDKSSFKLPCY